jgi:hypothetical protein
MKSPSPLAIWANSFALRSQFPIAQIPGLPGFDRYVNSAHARISRPSGVLRMAMKRKKERKVLAELV